MNFAWDKFKTATVTFEPSKGQRPARYRVVFEGEEERHYLVRGYDTSLPEIRALPAPGREIKGRGRRKDYPISIIHKRGKVVLEAVAYYVGDIDENGLYAD
ncbi:hypothetical protein [Roseibium aggregatum]|uniref:Uncharacterized protein n=1 Tax=Roseibium aggregatum TaxID=187304 RepID=A0A0M6Y8K2_9HYPH|nr:hypothetical protein [Roseibium aggregatum]CTQ45739.1 hypothetical protein LAL4801_04194 [Roseibium aggregatum]